jgi:leucyl aminopeptidase
MMKIAVRTITLERLSTDLLAIPVFEDKTLFQEAVETLRKQSGGLPPQITAGVFSGKKGQSLVLPSPYRAGQLLLLAGVGKRSDLTLEQLRRLGACAATTACSLRSAKFACVEPGHGTAELQTDDIAQSLVEGVLLASYRFSKYQTQNTEDRFTPSECTMIPARKGHLQHFTRGAERGQIICSAVYLARDLANAPGNEIYPETLAGHARAVGRGGAMKVSVFDERRIARLGMGGLLGVASGSAHPPRFVIMEYSPRKSSRRFPTIVLVGKGITFDSGGISIKPSANMAEMKMDMSGAAAVIGTLQAASRLAVPVHLIGLIPAAENLPGGRALKPGDILRHLNGMTSEVDNTDAEGRLILADALAYAGRYSPDLVIDLATLTGAVVVALGHIATGMLGTATDAMRRIEEAGSRTYERVWQLPMFEEYERLVKSDIADVKNVGGRWAGAITGAMFLKKFTGTFPWVHLDIAGTAITEESTEYTPKGGSGVGVRLLIDLLRHWNNL